MFDRSRSREWAHGLTALILGAVLLGAGVDLGISKSIVDLLGGMLSIPERPAILLRGIRFFQGDDNPLSQSAAAPKRDQHTAANI